MLYTFAVVLILLWLLGMVSSYTINGFIHLLLVIAIIVILVRIISGRKPLCRQPTHRHPGNGQNDDSHGLFVGSWA